MNPPKLLNQVREAARLRHLGLRTEQASAGWIRRYVLFHHKRFPRDTGVEEIPAFLSDLAVRRRGSASTRRQAFSALVPCSLKRNAPTPDRRRGIRESRRPAGYLRYNALKNGLNVSCAWARYCGRNPNITTLPRPTCASTTAAFPAIRSSPCAYPLRRIPRSG